MKIHELFLYLGNEAYNILCFQIVNENTLTVSLDETCRSVLKNPLFH